MSVVTLEQVKSDPEVRTYVECANQYLGAMGFTEHGLRHVALVAQIGHSVLSHLNLPEREQELVAIAGYLHDLGNAVSRHDHGQTGATIAASLLLSLGLPPLDVAAIAGAIGNHEEEHGQPVNDLSAALILADKSDVHRSRVRNTDPATFDIHDRVSYAAIRSFLNVSGEERSITLELTVETEICSVMEYFEIFLTRMMMCRRAAAFLDCRFHIVINGNEIARQIREELKEETARLNEKFGLVPGLVTILVGENPASLSYVTAKQKTSMEIGFYSVQDNQPQTIGEADLLRLIDRYNQDPKIHGILVQLPLPKQINETNILYAIDPKKDVDGFHPVNVGKLMIGEPDYLPCTPHGVWQLLIRSGVRIEGAEVVVVGRSNIVGKPIANMLLQKKKHANATVTVCHTGTKDIAAHTRRADILIVAAGKPKAVTADMVKEGVVVIDVGVNEVGKTADGKRILVGDVDFDAVKEKASAITPVPGGVGPMTITMLMMNTVRAAKLAAGLA